MANRRCLQPLTRHASTLFSINPSLPSLPLPFPLPHSRTHPALVQHSRGDEYNDDYDDNEVDGSIDEEEELKLVKKEYSLEEKEAEVAEIGYKVVGPLEPSDRVFKRYDSAFAVVQIGSHQFKVSNGDSIFTKRLKFYEVNDKVGCYGIYVIT
ncbi:hypothetical protein ACB092_01G415900 [Castanea dentata]